MPSAPSVFWCNDVHLVWAKHSLFTALLGPCICLLLLRVFVRARVLRALWWDDILMILAVVRESASPHLVVTPRPTHPILAGS